MRAQHESLRHGSLIYLNALDSNNEQHKHVIAFARHSNSETGIIAINFSSQASSFKLDLKPLLPILDAQLSFNSICYIEDWILEERGDFYFIREAISEGQMRTLAVNLNYN